MSSLASRLKKPGPIRRIGSATKTVLAAVGLYVTVPVAYEYYTLHKEKQKWKDKEKKGVLVLPFHKMKIVERCKVDLRKKFENLSTPSEGRVESFEMELRELIDIIHAAAEDPEIVALYGTFGTGTFSAGGYSHIEEIRNAIRVFNQSHRVHTEPNVHHDPNFKVSNEGNIKRTYAFADSFEATSRGNMQYYLASEFSHLHMQRRGNLHLFGPAVSVPFIRSFLEKYGIKVDVFKHGKYKNAPNSFSDTKFTPEHLENTQSLLQSIDDTICSGINQSRSLEGSFQNKKTWNAIRDYGTLTAPNAKEVGLIDFHPPINPLDDLIGASNDSETKKKIVEKWKDGTDVTAFRANHAVRLAEYSTKLKKRKMMEQGKREKEWKKHEFYEFLARNVLVKKLLARYDIVAPHFNINKDDFDKEKMRRKEKIIILNIGGGITSPIATKIIESLRKIKKDPNVKSVILRVDSPGGSATASEAIYSECLDLHQPILCSMSNYAASGGYYVAANAKKIFALPTTTTGSIGVFGLRPDLTEFASRYGINVEHVVTGSHSAMYNPFHPLTAKMKQTISRDVDNFYQIFKEIVAGGRNLTLDEVEAVAQGRVWTGEQAKNIGLVDEIGGINRAISYAQRNFTQSGEAEVEVWPKKLTFRQFLMSGNSLLTDETLKGGITAIEKMDFLRVFLGLASVRDGLGDEFSDVSGDRFSSLPSIMLTSSEFDAVRLMLEEAFLPRT